MSRDAVEALREVYDEWAKGNFRAGGELLTPDAVLTSFVERTTVRGPEGIGAYLRDFLAQWDDFRIHALSFTELGDSVLVEERQTGTGKASGIAMEQAFYALWTFAEGRVTHVRWDNDRAAALEAARG